MLRVLTIALFIFFLSCETANKPNFPKTELKATPALNSILPLLNHCWTDHADSSHQITFRNMQWYDIYNSDTTSVNPFRLFTNYLDRGGKEDLSGKYLVLEESPGNFYTFFIEQLDSLNLVLDFVTAGTKYNLYRQAQSVQLNELNAQDSIK